MVIKSAHTSTIEHASFTFAVEGISRVCSHQLVRHRIASFSQQSQRYVSLEDFNYVIPPKIKNNLKAEKIFLDHIRHLQRAYLDLKNLKILSEDARFLLPNACETKIVITMNARELLHFFELRLCNRAQWEIRKLAQRMLEKVKPLAPHIFKHAGPSCETEKICWEGKLSCGKWKTIPGAGLRERE
jgi:thymidylate synthase (FAD)